VKLVIADTGPVNYLIQIAILTFFRIFLKESRFPSLFSPSFPTPERHCRFSGGSRPLQYGLRSTTPLACQRFPVWTKEKPPRLR
jgi:hypothetical protein